MHAGLKNYFHLYPEDECYRASFGIAAVLATSQNERHSVSNMAGSQVLETVTTECTVPKYLYQGLWIII
jgi:hypothetical protein